MRLGGMRIGLLGSAKRSTAGASAPADFLVTNDAEFATANTNATAGQIIQLQDSGTFTDLTLTNATGVTVRAQTSQVPTLRTLTVNGAQNATVTGLKVQPTSAVAAGTRLVNLLGNLSGFTIENCYIRYGNPWNSFANFDPTVTDTSRMGTNAAWGATNPYATDLPIGIGSNGSAATSPSGSFTIKNNTVLDCGEGIKFNYGSSVLNGNPKINGNVVGRVYGDVITFAIPSAAQAIQSIEICGNEMFDCFAQPQDNGNPHNDLIQLTVPTTWTQPVTGLLVAGNIAWFSPGCRGSGQRIFSNGFDPGYPLVAPIIVDNVMLSRVTTWGVKLSSGDGEGAAWAYVYRNMMLANPVENVLRQNELFTNSVSGIGPSVVSTAVIAVANSSNYSNPRNWIAYNTAEGYTAFATDSTVGNLTTGLGTTANAYATWLDTDTTPEWNAITSADAALAALTLKTAYAANRPMNVGESAAAFRARWAEPGSRPWSSLPSWVDWVDLTGVTVSTTQTSEWAFVHAGNSTRSISISGGEYRIADDRLGTNATAWGSASGTIAHGKYLQVRQTASGTGSTTTTLTVTIGSDTANWSVTTASSIAYPIVLLDSTTPDLFRTSGTVSLGTDGRVGTLALLRMKVATGNPAVAVNIFQQVSGTGTIRVDLITDGKIRFRLTNPAGTTIVSVTTAAAVNTGNYFDLLISWDTNDTNINTGLSIYLNGSVSQTGTWISSASDIGYSRAIQYQFGPAATKDFEIGAFYLSTAARVDITSAANRNKFLADQIGTTGTGPTGAQPVIFLVGTAGQSGGWNDAAGINRGSGAKYIKVGSASATDVSGSAWP